MSGEEHRLCYGDYVIRFAIVRRSRRTLEIAVESDGSVVVTAPHDASFEAITQKLHKRARWVRRQQQYFGQFLPRTPARRFVAGETHLYLGRQYRLRVVPAGDATVRLVRGFFLVNSPEPARPEVTRALLEAWYMEHARRKFSERLELNLRRFSNPTPFRPTDIVVRKMRRRWGSMSPSRRLVLNRRLIEAPVDAIDYVITHELCHLAEPHHGPAFVNLLARVLPDWIDRKERLERAMA